MLGIGAAAGATTTVAPAARETEAKPASASVMLAEAQRLERLRALVKRHAIECHCSLCLGLNPVGASGGREQESNLPGTAGGPI
ncbi:hypothetical protein VK98_12130 [Chromobacterium sp. LK11]|nr:hypothetical protein VK98_12130 [Chromobacterium sp. LK11]